MYWLPFIRNDRTKEKTIVITEQGKEQIRLFEQAVSRFRDCILCGNMKIKIKLLKQKSSIVATFLRL